jgi:hypothetical protein
MKVTLKRLVICKLIHFCWFHIIAATFLQVSLYIFTQTCCLLGLSVLCILTRNRWLWTHILRWWPYVIVQFELLGETMVLMHYSSDAPSWWYWNLIYKHLIGLFFCIAFWTSSNLLLVPCCDRSQCIVIKVYAYIQMTEDRFHCPYWWVCKKDELC